MILQVKKFSALQLCGAGSRIAFHSVPGVRERAAAMLRHPARARERASALAGLLAGLRRGLDRGVGKPLQVRLQRRRLEPARPVRIRRPPRLDLARPMPGGARIRQTLHGPHLPNPALARPLSRLAPNLRDHKAAAEALPFAGSSLFPPDHADAASSAAPAAEDLAAGADASRMSPG